MDKSINYDFALDMLPYDTNTDHEILPYLTSISMLTQDIGDRPPTVLLTGDTRWRPFFIKVREDLLSAGVIPLLPNLFPEYWEGKITREDIVEARRVHRGMARSADVIYVIQPCGVLSTNASEDVHYFTRPIDEGGLGIPVLYDSRGELPDLLTWYS
mgnify:CR=1 FL=1